MFFMRSIGMASKRQNGSGAKIRKLLQTIPMAEWNNTKRMKERIKTAGIKASDATFYAQRKALVKQPKIKEEEDSNSYSPNNIQYIIEVSKCVEKVGLPRMKRIIAGMEKI